MNADSDSLQKIKEDMRKDADHADLIGDHETFALLDRQAGGWGMSICPFCKRDPFHYVDNGVGYERVAINCCEAGIALYNGEKIARQALEFMRSHSPRKKARAKHLLEQLN